jgi:hypothetical protein
MRLKYKNDNLKKGLRYTEHGKDWQLWKEDMWNQTERKEKKE